MPAPIPNARQQFIDKNGIPLAGGSVYSYIVGSTTPKTTFQDPLGGTANANPIILDSMGSAQIFGFGLYRQQVYDASGNLIWDAETGLPFSQDLALQFFLQDTGTADNMVVSLRAEPESIGDLVGATFFIQVAATNTGATTLTLNNFGAYPVQQVNAALPAGVLVAGAVYPFTFTGSVWILTGAFTSAVTLSQLQGGTISPTFSATTVDGVLTVAPPAGQTVDIKVTDTGANGVNIKLIGDGTAAPSKTIRVHGGLFQVMNDAGSGIIMQLDDGGNLHVAGNIQSNGI